MADVWTSFSFCLSSRAALVCSRKSFFLLVVEWYVSILGIQQGRGRREGEYWRVKCFLKLGVVVFRGRPQQRIIAF